MLDELGFIPFSPAAAQLLFTFYSELHERVAVIVTSNLKFADWIQIFGQERLTAALLDRLTQKAHILELIGESYRFRQRLQRDARQAAHPDYDGDCQCLFRYLSASSGPQSDRSITGMIEPIYDQVGSFSLMTATSRLTASGLQFDDEVGSICMIINSPLWCMTRQVGVAQTSRPTYCSSCATAGAIGSRCLK